MLTRNHLILCVVVVLAIICGGFWHGSGPKTYYISSTGNDSNAGTAISPWLTPNHAVNCGDTISVAAGSYSTNILQYGNWGTVSNCPSPAGIYFAKFVCAGPYIDSCAFTSSTGDFNITASNWAIIGGSYQSTYVTGGYHAPCISNGSTGLHHLAFINVEAVGCGGQGINASGVDYVAVVGAIVQGVQANGGLAIEFYEPLTYDTNAGTHYYAAGNFVWGTLDASNVDGSAISDDTWDHNSYTQQGVFENNIFIGNAGPALTHGPLSSGAVIIYRYNTTWGNVTDTSYGYSTGDGFVTNPGGSGTGSFTAQYNLMQATLASQNGYTVYGAQIITVVNANIANNYIYGVSGHNEGGTPYGSNTTSSPGFINPSIPGAPSLNCGVLSVNCMTATIANFVPTLAPTTSGYQPPGSCAPNSYYPIWLKGVVPNGLITKPCGY